MDFEELKIRFLQVRMDMDRVRGEQRNVGFMPSPDYVKPIGAYADDDPFVHSSEVLEDADLVDR